MSVLARRAVSKQKHRYEKNGSSLDLAYITPNIIAMGFPSEGLEGAFRNPYNEVLQFLDEMHKDHFKVYNLCSERDYPASKFYNRVAKFGFEDHNAPPFGIMEEFCKDLKVYLDQDAQNVGVIHCKAGKGRTGVMISCWMLYSRQWSSPEDAMRFYAATRTRDKKGVTIPSQIRYIRYFATFLRYGVPPEQPLLLTKIVFKNIPKFFYQTDIRIFVSDHSKQIRFSYKESTKELARAQSKLKKKRK